MSKPAPLEDVKKVSTQVPLPRTPHKNAASRWLHMGRSGSRLPSDQCRYYGPVGLPLPSARVHHRLIRAVFADEAGKTGLSCSEPNRANVALPLPREDPTKATPERR